MRLASVLLLALSPAFASVHVPAPAPPTADDLVLVVIATAELSPGMAIPPGSLSVVAMPRRYAHPHALASLGRVIGQVPHERILVGETILAERLADAATGTGAAVLIPAGMRGFVVMPDNGAGLAEVGPGTRVDLLHTEPTHPTITLIQDIEVLTVRYEPTGAPWFVLSVTAHEAETLARARTTGQIAFTVRAANRGNRAEPS